MKLILIFGMAIGVSFAEECWWTGCQPNDWGVVGCDQYGRVEKGKEDCADNRGTAGFKYNCCEGQGQGESSSGTGNSSSSSSDNNNGEVSDLSINFSQFSEAVTSNGFPAPSQDQFNSFMKYLKSQGKISTLQEAAMALAQFIYESDGLRAKIEYSCIESKCPNSYRTPSCDAPNTYYYGRGYIQLTWCGNYRAASLAIFGDDRLVKNPDAVAENDELAWQCALWYWGSRVHGKSGVEEGFFGSSTKEINPLECEGNSHPAPAKRYKYYGKVRAAFGLAGPGDSTGC